MPGKSGGFFKRMKAKHKAQTKRASRGTTGMKKQDRIIKHNALVDIYAAQKQLKELEELSSSGDEDDGASSENSSVAPGDRSLSALRAMLGVSAGKAVDSDDDGDSEQHEVDDDAMDEHADEEAEDGEEDEAQQFCNLCGANLEDVEGVACTECKLCYCYECHEGTHAALGHDVVDLAALDDEEEEDGDADQDYFGNASRKHRQGDKDDDETNGEEDEEVDESDEGDKGDQAAQFFDAEANEPGDAERKERQRAFLPDFAYNANVQGKAMIASVVGGPQDPFFKAFVVSEPLSKAPPHHQQQQPVELMATIAALQPLNGADEKTSPNATTSVRAAPSTAQWLTTALKGQQQQQSDERPPWISAFLWKKWTAYKASTAPGQPALTPEARAKLALLSTYDDLNSALRPWSAEPSLLDAVALHLLNHWAKSTAVIAANDEALKRRRQAAKKAKNGAADDDDDDDFEARDRGFAKTRLLLVVPMRHLALKYMQIFRGVLGLRDTPSTMKYEMFERDFSEIEEIIDPLFHKRQEDYKRQFEGNINDSFCVGASFRASGINVYTHPLNSDILVCSPLGLRKRLPKDADAVLSLASIEVAIFDQAHVLSMQNWDHVTELLKLLNQRPRDTTEGLNDFARVYGWALDNKAFEHRQTVFVSGVAAAHINSAMRQLCQLGVRNRISHSLEDDPGVLPMITHSVRQHVVRFACNSVAEVDDARFEFFKTQIFAAKIRPLVDRNVRTILFVPSFFDFQRLRLFLDEELRGSYAELMEHTSDKAQRQALGQFSALERPLLVMTERFYFFKRYFVKHAEAIIFYSPPVMPAFYTAMINRMSRESTNATVLMLCCRYDLLELARVLGTTRAHQVLTRPASSYLFASTSATTKRGLVIGDMEKTR